MGGWNTPPRPPLPFWMYIITSGERGKEGGREGGREGRREGGGDGSMGRGGERWREGERAV